MKISFLSLLNVKITLIKPKYLPRKISSCKSTKKRTDNGNSFFRRKSSVTF